MGNEDYETRLQEGRSYVENLLNDKNCSRQSSSSDVIALGEYYFDANILPFLMQCLDKKQQINYLQGKSLPGSLSITYDMNFEESWLRCGNSFSIRFENNCLFSNKIIDLLVEILLRNEDETVRWQSANVLRVLKDERALQGLNKGTKDEEPDVSDESIDALQEIQAGTLFRINTTSSANTTSDNLTPKSRSDLSSETDGCFIATAVYDTPLAQEVTFLIHFRDNVLLKSHFGKKVVKIYNIISPPIANKIRNSFALKIIIQKIFLNPTIKILKKMMGLNQIC